MLHREKRKVLMSSGSLLMKEAYVKNSINFTENLCLQDIWRLQNTKGEIPQKYPWHVPHLTELAQTFGKISQHLFSCTRRLGWAYCLSFPLQAFTRCRISQVASTKYSLAPSETLANLQQKRSITLPLLSNTCLFGSRLICKSIYYKFEPLSFKSPQHTFD